MKRLFSLFAALLLLFGIFPYQALADSQATMTGSGEVADPYVIMTLDHLNEVRNDLSAHYKLGADIDAAETANWNDGEGFIPIGGDGNNDSQFIGTFDGQDHVISGLTINKPSSDLIGLFGIIGSGGVVRNVGLEGGSITGKLYTGGLAGRNRGTVDKSYVTGTVSSSGLVGGLVGHNDIGSTVTESYAMGAVSGNNYAGGLVGLNDATVSHSYATGSVIGTFIVGGLAGGNEGGTVSQSYATGAVSGSASNVGGLVGYNVQGMINQSYATGSVNGDSAVGGLAGNNVSGSISQSYATGTVSGTTNVGGLLGGNSGTITSSYWDRDTTKQADPFGNNSGTFNVASFSTAQALTKGSYPGWDFNNDWFMVEGSTRPFLRSEYSTTISNTHQLQLLAMNLTANYSLAKNIDFGTIFTDNSRSDMWATGMSGDIITGAGFVPIGGMGSPEFSGTFDGLGHMIGNLTIHRPTSSDVGLFGSVQTNGVLKNIGLEGGSVIGDIAVGGLVGVNFGSLSNAYNTGSVRGTDSIGGLVGRNKSGTISEAYSAGNVSGRTFIGGLVGENYAEVRDAYVTGTVNGNSEVGGLTGRIFGSGSVNTSYATGAVKGNAYVGGLVGYGASVSASFYDSQTTNHSDEGKGEPKTTSEMKRVATFQPGWDFTDTWVIEEGKAYPVLQGIAANAGLDAAPPTIVSAKVEDDHPDRVVVTFDEDVSIADASGVTIQVDGNVATVTNHFLMGQRVLTFSINNAIGHGQGVTISYDGQLGNIADTARNSLHGFADLSVENNVNALEAPTNLTAAADNSQITLTWNGASKASGYKVYMGTDSGTYAQTPVATVTEATYSVTGLTYGTTYYFAVKSSTAIEDSEYSNEVSGALLDHTLPSINLGTNGSETWAISAQTAVTVTDSNIGVDDSTLQYAWSTDIATPASGWISFTNGDTLTKNGVDGDWYLHVQALDLAGNKANLVSRRFRLDASVAALSGLTVTDGTLSPAFAENTTSYALSVGNRVSGLTLVPVSADATDTITVAVNGRTAQPVESGEMSEILALHEGVNTITLHVTALNGLRQTYTVTVTRASSSNGGSSTQINPARFVSMDGGTIVFDGGEIIIPSGALNRSINITISEVMNTNALPLSNREQLASKVFEITKDQSGKFNKEVVLRLKFAANAIEKQNFKISLYWFNEETNEWAELDNILVDWEKRTVSGVTDHFTKFAVIAMPVKAAEQPQPEETDVHFTDIKGHWAEKNIEKLAAKGAVKGYSNGTFKPDHPITRAEFTAILVRALELPQIEGKVFADTADHWAGRAISSASAYGIIQGNNQHKFAPDGLVTREQMAVMIVNALQLENRQASHAFADRESIAAWAQEAVAAAVEHGVIAGYPDNTMKPKANATRAEAVTVILHAIEIEKE
ncbi:S-layer homology domain-containing protein [Cohnella herbarum]|uniref:S-layer homology domain-containing protein n=1 Tax=Cohnella herbarum TaxID=2728023 RepID=A0A7Z2VHA2_9BACL|nr:S-layer homology domain-containing protein [Cohnella herbarum]QJD83171.1 hypothetical protein HH215_08290 [Cohnella herbarum]